MIQPRRSLLSLIAPVALLAAGGCLATRSDVERMELTLKTMQDSARIRQARSDSMTRTLVSAATQQLQQNFTREFNAISDSVKQVGAAVQKLQGDMTLSVYDLRTQLTVVQEGLGQSNKRMQEIKSSVEAGAQATRPADPSAAGSGPTANQLYSTANRLLMTGSTGTARQNYQDFVTNFPADDRVPDAQNNIAASFAAEGNRVAADSIYALVAQKYPKSDAAPTALFKRARFAQEVKDTLRARALWQEIVTKYPKSEAGVSAAAELSTPKKP